MIYSLQQELVDVAALKASAIWREKGERSARYLKNVHQRRTAQQYMASLQSPIPDTAGNTTASSNPGLMNQHAQQYYQQLYSIDPVEPTDTSSYLDRITSTRKLDTSDAEFLESEIDLDDLIYLTKRLSKCSSPGADRIGYPFLTLLFRMSCLKQLVIDLYNDALKRNIPSSWQDIRVRLLPKKKRRPFFPKKLEPNFSYL